MFFICHVDRATHPGSTPAESTRTSHLQDLLTDCVDLGHRLTRKIVEKAEADTLPAEKAASAYDRVTRSMRRSAWLVGHLDRPAKPSTAPPPASRSSAPSKTPSSARPTTRTTSKRSPKN